MSNTTMYIHDVTDLMVQYTPDVQDTGTNVRDIVIKTAYGEFCITLFSKTADATAPKTEKGETWE